MKKLLEAVFIGFLVEPIMTLLVIALILLFPKILGFPDWITYILGGCIGGYLAIKTAKTSSLEKERKQKLLNYLRRKNYK